MARMLLLAAAALVASVAAQTSTSCSPLNGTCPDDAALGTSYNVTYNAQSTDIGPDFWDILAGEQFIAYTDKGAELTISKTGQSVTVESSFYIFWGRIEVIMQAAAGQGIISTFCTLSDDLDEIDLEIMGGNQSFVESNWYGWGNTAQYNAKYHPTDGPQNGMHNYTILWSEEQIEWIIDGTSARTIKSAAPEQYPQTPSKLKYGIWAGGDSTQPNGTIEWAGGPTDWSKGPFTMIIQSITVTDGATNVTSYSYSDKTGSSDSIKSTPGESKAYLAINKKSSTEKTIAHFNSLSTGAKVGIAAGVGGVLVIAIIAFAFYCIKQRRAGKREKAIADREWDSQRAELLAYRNQMQRGQFARDHMGHGEKNY